MSHGACTDCGTRPAWWFAVLTGGPKYCERCFRKSGESSVVEADPAKILAECEGDEAAAVRLINRIQLP